LGSHAVFPSGNVVRVPATVQRVSLSASARALNLVGESARPSSQRWAPISVAELMQRDLDELVVERKVLEMMASARWAREIQIINALIPGNITCALEGEHVGTIITADD
jgi:hypothetical protein